MDTISRITRKTIKYLSVPFILLILHWVLVRVYSSYCAPQSLIGLITSFVSVGSPICVMMMTIIEKTSTLYISSWVFITMLCLGFIAGLVDSNNGKKNE
jgi:hypothetical protein